MGTVTNGKKWVGACVNGKTVSGLAKNGVVFYRMPVSTYRRRIMVGDNLKGKDIFSTIPQGFWQNYVTSTEIINNVDYDLVMFQNTNWNDYIRFYTTKNESLLPVVRLYDYGGIPNEIYSYQADINKETNNSKTTHKNDKDYIVSSIVENNVYRHLYIEDENIRPVQVGDVITSNTKFYFTFPDDFSKKVSPQTMAIISAKYSDNSSAMNLWYSKIASTNNVYFNFYGMSGYSQENVYSTNSSGDVTTNISYKNLAVTSPITISAINNTDIAKYVLVDTTTLGA